MATEEIEISQLELAEDLAPDMVLPVETTTDTKATTLQKIKEWMGSFFVDKTSNEEIDGYKRFKRYISVINNLFIDSGEVVKGTTPSITKYFSCSFGDNKKSGLEKDRFGGITGVLGADGNVRSDLRCYKNVSDSVEHVRLSVGYDVYGNPISFAPASPATNSIVTTTGISKTQNGYVKLGNGIIIQWGIATKASETTVTFPTAFTTAPNVQLSVKDGNGNHFAKAPVSVTTTGFTAKSYSGSANYDTYWIAIGY